MEEVRLGGDTSRRRDEGRRSEQDERSGAQHEGLIVLATPETDVRSAPLTRTLPFPCTGLLWRINIKSSP